MGLSLSKAIRISFEESVNSNWTLVISNENNSTHLGFGLHWGDKTSPTHFGVIDKKVFEKEIKELLAEQVVL